MFFKRPTVDKIFKQAPWLPINIDLSTTGIEDLGQAFVLRFNNVVNFKKIAVLIEKSGGCPIKINTQLTLIIFKHELGKIKQTIYSNRITYTERELSIFSTQLSKHFPLEHYLKSDDDCHYSPINFNTP